MPAIEESIFAGVPVNVTLLFSREHYLAAAEAYLRGIERRDIADHLQRTGSRGAVRSKDVYGSVIRHIDFDAGLIDDALDHLTAGSD